MSGKDLSDTGTHLGVMTQVKVRGNSLAVDSWLDQVCFQASSSCDVLGPWPREAVQQGRWVYSKAPPLEGCVNVGSVSCLSEPQLPHLQE